MKITVLMGGVSAERDVSLASGLRIAQALRTRGHEVVSLDTARGALSSAEESALLSGQVLKTAPPDIKSLARLQHSRSASLPELPETDVVFLALHGGHGEDGTVQALLDLTGVPYTGSGHLGSALAMDQDLSKKLFEAAGVPTPKWLMAPHEWESWHSSERSDFTGKVARQVGFPLIVKPNKQGSTVGLALVRDPAE